MNGLEFIASSGKPSYSKLAGKVPVQDAPNWRRRVKMALATMGVVMILVGADCGATSTCQGSTTGCSWDGGNVPSLVK